MKGRATANPTNSLGGVCKHSASKQQRGTVATSRCGGEPLEVADAGTRVGIRDNAAGHSDLRAVFHGGSEAEQSAALNKASGRVCSNFRGRHGVLAQQAGVVWCGGVVYDKCQQGLQCLS
jgi:hypothetical protein